MNRAILGGAMLAVLGTGLFAGYAFTARSQVSERELRGLEADMQAAHDRLAREVELLRDSVEARGGMASPAPWSGDAVRVPDPAAARSAERERDDERRSSRTPEDLVNAFPTLVGDAKADAIEELVELARQQDAKALDLIVASLGDEDAEVREEAVEAIGELADPALVDALTRLKSDPSERVREEVADALGRMPADRAGPVLAELIADSSRDVAEEAIDAIGEVGYRGALPQLVDLVRRGDDYELIAEAGSTLRRLGESAAVGEAVTRIASALESKDAVDRLDAVRHLRTVGGEEAIALLRNVVERDSSVSVRAEAREALDRLLRE